jgi:hypothetical protein
MEIGEAEKVILYVKKSEQNTIAIQDIEKSLKKNNIRYKIEELTMEQSKFMSHPQLCTSLGPFYSVESYLKEKTEKEEIKKEEDEK